MGILYKLQQVKGENAKTPYINIKVQITRRICQLRQTYANCAKNTYCSKILVTSEKIEVWGVTHMNESPPWVWFTAAAALWGRGWPT